MKNAIVKSITMLCLALPSTAFAQVVAGGQSGFDNSIEALVPERQSASVTLAGESPADISRFILAGNQGARNARISPDGSTIAFSWSITGNRQVWLVPSTGGQPKQLTFGNGVSTFRWSPDGHSIFYSADNNGNEQEAYYTISADGLRETEVLPSAQGGFRVFGDYVDNNTITYASTERNKLDFDIYTANLDTQKITRIFEGTFGFFANAVSPNGRYIVISETVGEDSDNLYLFDRETQSMSTVSKPTRRANHTNAGIVWTADNKGFYLSSNLDRDFAALMYYSLSEGFTTKHSSEVDVESVRLCGNADQFLVWSENHGGYSQIQGIDLRSNESLPIPAMMDGVYQLNCAAQDNSVAITVNSYQTPGNIYHWDLGSGQINAAFTANLAGLASSQLVKPESITMPARDGVQLQGLLYMPKVEKGTKPPVVFRVHGGPTAQSRPRFSASTQYLVGKGIAVFLPNVRGSTGFGHTYVTLDDRENRLDSIRDLVDMLAYLKQDGRVDTERAAVAGGSYGGYAVNAVLANFPGHFKAGVSLYGVADWVTALQVASPALKAADRIEYGDITEQKWLDFYTQQSPIRQADQIDVPVLYSHGVMDPRIDIYETEVMVKTLRKNGIEAPFIRIPDEGHGWRKLSNQLFYYREEAKFLERHLGE